MTKIVKLTVTLCLVAFVAACDVQPRAAADDNMPMEKMTKDPMSQKM